MNRNQNIRKVLLGGRCSSSEVAAILKITPRSARVGLWVLKKQKHVQPVASIRVEGVKRPVFLYDLTPAGRAAFRKCRRAVKKGLPL